jgi:hypothetical protein
MALHKDLTGDELHEPKGVASAAEGTVYVADGSGSGTWSPLSGDSFLLNKYWMTGEIADITSPTDRVFLYIPVNSEMVDLAVVLNEPITTANDTLSIYVNGVLFADTLTVVQAGSFTGQLQKRTFTTANSVAGGSVVEIRTAGTSDGGVRAFVSLGLRAIG